MVAPSRFVFAVACNVSVAYGIGPRDLSKPEVPLPSWLGWHRQPWGDMSCVRRATNYVLSVVLGHKSHVGSWYFDSDEKIDNFGRTHNVHYPPMFALNPRAKETTHGAPDKAIFELSDGALCLESMVKDRQLADDQRTWLNIGDLRKEDVVEMLELWASSHLFGPDYEFDEQHYEQKPHNGKFLNPPRVSNHVKALAMGFQPWESASPKRYVTRVRLPDGTEDNVSTIDDLKKWAKPGNTLLYQWVEGTDHVFVRGDASGVFEQYRGHKVLNANDEPISSFDQLDLSGDRIRLQRFNTMLGNRFDKGRELRSLPQAIPADESYTFLTSSGTHSTMWFNQPDKNDVPGAAGEDDKILPGWYFVDSLNESRGPMTWEQARSELPKTGVRYVVSTPGSGLQKDRFGRTIPESRVVRRNIDPKFVFGDAFFHEYPTMKKRLVDAITANNGNLVGEFITLSNQLTIKF